MKSQEQFIKNSTRNLIIVKKNNRRKNFTRPQNLNKKYLLEGETKEIGNFVVQRNTTSNTKFVTFQFIDHNKRLIDQQKHLSNNIKQLPLNPSCLPNKTMSPSAFKSNPFNHKELYIQVMRPNKKWHLSNYRIDSCQLKRLQNEICNKKNSIAINNGISEDDFQSFKLEVQGCNKNMMQYFSQSGAIQRISTSSDRRSNIKNIKMRITSGIGTTRLKSHQNINNRQVMIPELTPAQINQLMRRPTFKKGHFVFGLSDKCQPVQNKMQIFRDFLWKINYSNRLIVLPQVQMSQPYKLFMGKGNNSFMVQGILKRRSWWILTDKQQQANFAWTQLKLNNLFKLQSYNQKRPTKKEVYNFCIIHRSQKRQTSHDIKQGIQQKQKVQQFTSKTNIEVLNRQNQSFDYLDSNKKIFNMIDYENWRENHKKYNNKSQAIGNTFKKRYNFLIKKKLMKIESPFTFKMHNHLFENYYIGNKKALFYNLRKYYEFTKQNIFDYVPLTFHIIKGVQDIRYLQFVKKYEQLEKIRAKNKQFKNIWIMKPGQNTNRGNGITVCFSLDDIKYRLKMKEKNKDGGLRTFIIQKYIQKPLLYKSRKFDIRHYMLVTCIAGNIKAYWYQCGYVRTSSSAYSLKNHKDLFVHLTNDAIQKNGQDYGKYESGNKISYDDLERYIRKKCKKDLKQKEVSFLEQILPKMKKIANDSVKSTFNILDRERRYNNFELLGLDFMINQDYNPYLIEVNTNPCLELSCPLLQSLIPQLIDNLFKVCVDPLFPPPQNIPQSKKQFYNFQDPLIQNRFQLIFDELIQGQELRQLFVGRQKMDAQLGNIQEDDEQFDNDGVEWQQKKNE